MSRIARIIVPGYPHHIIQRGNRRQRVFFSDKDKFVYLKLLKKQSQKYGLIFWAYCLMDNHVHLVAIPEHKDSFRAVAETNRRYTQMINLREGWRGYLWQGRFASFVMDEAYCYTTIRYVENNPVRANLVNYAQEYHFSSAKYHVYDRQDSLVVPCFLQDKILDWREYLNEETGDIDQIRKHQRTGRPLGSNEFIDKIEQRLGRIISKQKPGPKARMN